MIQNYVWLGRRDQLPCPILYTGEGGMCKSLDMRGVYSVILWCLESTPCCIHTMLMYGKMLEYITSLDPNSIIL